ncbi:hypothetical protein NL676_001945 [Syzygium grande]|nr:hypothetical protein NL676_001945 [Syzygium grande]
MFEVTRVMSSLIIIALIIIGFSFFKPFLQKEEAKVIIVAIALQVLPSVALPFAMTMGETWPDVVLLLSWLHLICVCTILLMTGRSHWLLHKAAKIDKKAATSSTKINKFDQLYILAMAYLYEIPVLADSLRVVMAYENSWVSNVMERDEKEETMAAANEESGV